MTKKQEIQTRLAQLGDCLLAESEFMYEAETDIRYLLEKVELLEKEIEVLEEAIVGYANTIIKYRELEEMK